MAMTTVLDKALLRAARVRDIALANGYLPWNRAMLFRRDLAEMGHEVELVSWPWCDAPDGEVATCFNVKVNVRLVPGDPMTMVTVAVGDLSPISHEERHAWDAGRTVMEPEGAPMDAARRLTLWEWYAAVFAVGCGIAWWLLR